MTGSGASTFFARACAFTACALGFAFGNGACSGAADSGLFEPAVGLGDESPIDAGHAGHTAADAGSKPPADRDAQGDPAAPPDSAPPPSDHDAAALDASFPDVAPPAEPPGIRCGNATCDPASDVCCRIPGGATDVFACLSRAACTSISGALDIPCDDAVDCAGTGATNGDDVCCVTLNAQSGKAESIACAPTGSCAGTLQTNMCSTNAPDACPNGGTCKISQTTIPGYDICF